MTILNERYAELDGVKKLLGPMIAPTFILGISAQ
jgi:hypothetical protein